MTTLPFINHRLNIQNPHTVTPWHSIGVWRYGGILLLLVLFPVLVLAQPLHNGTTPSGVQDPASEIIGADGAPMVLIPAGEFLMGRPPGKDSQKGDEHSVTLDAFYIDKYEVTISRYEQFLKTTGRFKKTNRSRANPRNHSNWPVELISWYEADAYCEYYGRRLPTEAEWEKAARGTDGRIYPWGNRLPKGGRYSRYWYIGKTRFLKPRGFGGIIEVGSNEAGMSPYGVHGLGGNVGEWVADWYAGGYNQDGPRENPKGPSEGGSKVIRGGFLISPVITRTYERFNCPPAARFKRVGFRCAQDIP